MRSFAAFATIATAAFAAVASAFPVQAAPAPPGVDNGVTHLTPPRAVQLPKGGVVHFSKAEKAERSATGSLALAKVEKSRQPGYQGHSIIDIIVDLNAKVEPLCGKLTAAISGDIEVAAAVDVSLEVLGEIKGLLVTATTDIHAAIVVGVDLLVLDGKVLAVNAVAEIIATLVISITTVLSLVIKVCASAKVDVLIRLCAEIGVELAAIISLVVKICANLVVVVKPLISVVANIIVDLDLKALIQVLVLGGGSHY